LHTAAGVLNANAYIEASLITRVFDTDSGGTLWTRAASGKTRVANISVMEEGSFSFGVSDPRKIRETDSGTGVPIWTFRPYYEYQTVK
jgi:hypothetical protein